MTASFLLSSDGRIVEKSDSGSTMLYGYLLDFKESVGFEKAFIKILSSDNAVLIYPVAKTVKVNNGTPISANNLKSSKAMLHRSPLKAHSISSLPTSTATSFWPTCNTM